MHSWFKRLGNFKAIQTLCGCLLVWAHLFFLIDSIENHADTLRNQMAHNLVSAVHPNNNFLSSNNKHITQTPLPISGILTIV